MPAFESKKKPKATSQTTTEDRQTQFNPTTVTRAESTPGRTPTLLASPKRVQPKLKINRPGDAYEQEADHAANQLQSGPAASQARSAPLQIQRAPTSDAGQGDAPPIVDEALATPGQPLEPTTRQFMEQYFGQGLGQVRVHTGDQAAQSADSIQASAYTLGQDVVFGAGEYAPGTAEGDHLLAHELTHTIQQGNASDMIQRSLKFEIQTTNRIWAVKNSGKPDPKLLPRKYSATSKGFGKKATQERGDRPAYLATGNVGRAARRKGQFVEAEGPRVTEEGKPAGSGVTEAQFVRTFQFKQQVAEADLIGKPVGKGVLEQVSVVNNADDPAMSGTFNPNTFENIYLNADGSQLDVHLGPDRTFKAGHKKLMKVGRAKLSKKKSAQYEETWKVTENPKGKAELDGKRVSVRRVSQVNNAKVKSKEGTFNPNTYEKNYFLATDFKGNKLTAGAKPLDVHRDLEGNFQEGHVKFMEKLQENEEQTAIELQSETGGFIEFETPKWFRTWADIAVRIQEAVGMTETISNQVGTPDEITDPAILDEIKKQTTGPLGHIVKWPTDFNTADLKGLRASKRHLLIQITDPTWLARIQASEAIELSEFETLLKENEEAAITSIVTTNASAVFAPAFAEAKRLDPSLQESQFANLKGFLQLLMDYIVRGQTVYSAGMNPKFVFTLMSRTNFGSMHKNLLSAPEKALFKKLVGDRRKADDNPILSALEAPINARLTGAGKDTVTLNRKTPFFYQSKSKGAKGTTIYQWLKGISENKDLIRGQRSGISDAMGARPVEMTPDDKEYKRAQFEIRGTISHGGTDRPASEWLTYARNIFEAAEARASDTADDPTTPGVDESSKTGLKDSTVGEVLTKFFLNE